MSHDKSLQTLQISRNPTRLGRVALIADWLLLTDFGAIKRARVPISHSLLIPYRLKQHALWGLALL